MSKLESLSLEQALPAPVGDRDLNICPDPDCPNYGVSASFGGVRLLAPPC